MELTVHYINGSDIGKPFTTPCVIEVEELLRYIDDARDNGNIKGEKGFSAALFLSQLIKRLEEVK